MQPRIQRHGRAAPARWLATAAVLSIVFACSPAEAPEQPLVVSSDPALASAATALLPDLAERSGLELLHPVRVERRARTELEDYLRFKLNEELTAEQADYEVSVYSRLGLVAPDLDLRALLMEVYMEQVSGFYDPDSTALFVLDDQPSDVLEALLLHELVHAIQDQTADLDAITDPSLGNDRVQAAAAAIEGHATLVMFEYALEQQQGEPVDLTTIPGFSDRFMPALEAMQAQSPVLSAAPRIVREALLFPYLGGAGFVEAAWKGGGARIAPFGDHLPKSTEEILFPAEYLAEPRSEVLSLELTVPDGWRSLHQDALGAFEISVLLDEHSGGETSVEGWEGDRFVLMESDQEDRALSWTSVWSSVDVRDEVLAALMRVGDGVGWTSVTATDVADRPGITVVVGDSGPAGATLRTGG